MKSQQQRQNDDVVKFRDGGESRLDQPGNVADEQNRVPRVCCVRRRRLGWDLDIYY